MKARRVRLAVEPLAKTQERWKRALKGKTSSSDEVITVASWDVIGKVLSASRLEILARVPTLKPKSISALARSLKRDFKNVYSDVTFLADLGLLELREEGKRKTLVPVVHFTGIEVDLRRGAAA
jgi:predicted transcriptional regulator